MDLDSSPTQATHRRLNTVILGRFYYWSFKENVMGDARLLGHLHCGHETATIHGYVIPKKQWKRARAKLV